MICTRCGKSFSGKKAKIYKDKVYGISCYKIILELYKYKKIYPKFCKFKDNNCFECLYNYRCKINLNRGGTSGF